VVPELLGGELQQKDHFMTTQPVPFSEAFMPRTQRRPKVDSILSFKGWTPDEIAAFSRKLLRMAKRDPGGFVYSYPNNNYSAASVVREAETVFPEPPRRSDVKAFLVKAGFPDADAELILSASGR